MKRAKRILACILAMVVILAIVPVSVSAGLLDISGSYEGMDYRINEEECTIEIVRCASKADVVIPSEIEGYPVTSIAAYAFSGNDYLTELIIPDSVTNIGQYAFENNASLKSVLLPSSLSSLGFRAFGNCDSLEYAEFQEGITEVPTSCFYDCNALKEVKLSPTINSVGAYAFSNCYSLEKIELPEVLSVIGDYAFERCYALKSINTPESLTWIGKKAFVYCGITSFVYPKGSTIISEHAFACSDLEEIVLHDNITEIRDNAFWRCKNLRSIDLPDSILRIGMGAFQLCSALEEVKLPDNGSHYSYIDYKTFSDCESLKSITITDNITDIGSAFDGCISLSEIDLPDRGVSVVHDAFNGTAYYNNPANWTDGMLTIEGYLICADTNVATGVVTVPKNVHTISLAAFKNCTDITVLDITEGVECIEELAFDGCINLEELYLPSTLNYMGDSFYNGCTGLKRTIYNGNRDQFNSIEIGDYYLDIKFKNTLEFGYLFGDVDGDKNVSAADSLIMKKYLSHTITFNKYNSKVADINGDGRVNAKDQLMLRRMLAGV